MYRERAAAWVPRSLRRESNASGRWDTTDTEEISEFFRVM